MSATFPNEQKKARRLSKKKVFDGHASEKETKSVLQDSPTIDSTMNPFASPSARTSFVFTFFLVTSFPPKKERKQIKKHIS